MHNIDQTADTAAVENRNQLFDNREKALAEELHKKQIISDRYSNGRMIFFVGAIALGGLFWYLKIPQLALSLFSVFFIVFMLLIFLHNRYKKAIILLEALVKIQEEYGARTEHDFSKLSDTGEDFYDGDHVFSGDLDLFGTNSLFHLMSTAQTWFGRQTFAKYLLWGERKDKSADDIKKRQQAVSELAQDLPRLQEFQAAGRLSKQNARDPKVLLEYVRQQDNSKPVVRAWECVLALVLTTGLVVTTVLYLLGGIVSAFVPLGILLIQLASLAYHYQRFKPVLLSVEDFHSELLAYAELFEDIQKAQVSSTLLKETQHILQGSDNLSASDRLKKLHKICLAIQARNQPLLFLILNLLCSYDTYCVYFLERWKKDSGSRLDSYMEALGVWEGLMCLSTLSFVYPESGFAKFPAVSSQRPYFVGVNMGHPLIPVNRQIRNDFDLRYGTALITGSNMSGKTTLLRTVGINAVLAYSGAICCGSLVELELMQIATSMRIADNLSEGLSTFYAELIRIEKVISMSKQEVPLLFLIDEIFRGTNSRDRTDGAKIVLKNLNRPWIIGLMSTHDYELCSLGEQDGVNLTNYHFSEYYDENGIHFNYKLDLGVSVSANARYLMKMIGIE